MSRFNALLFIFMRYYRNLGLRVSLYALLSLLAAFLGPVIQDYLSAATKSMIDFKSVLPVLTILASSMLAVSTFSLNIMVSAHRAAAQTTTPRVHRLLLENTTTQSVLATFIGAFVYSLSSIILYQAGFYKESAAVVVMGITIIVVVLVVLAMLRWIEHLTDLGSVEDSLKTVTERAHDTLMAFAKDPALGGARLAHDASVPESAEPLRAARSGYLQLVDVPSLKDCLPDGAQLFLTCRPGAHVLSGQTIGYLSRTLPDDALQSLTEAFDIGDHRTFEQDAEYGLVVLSEIASKALSPGVNDPGTAIATIENLKTLLWDVARAEAENDTNGAQDENGENDKPAAPAVFIPVPDHSTLFETAFAPIARDGADTIEVALTLRHALHALYQSPDRPTSDAARQMAALALEYCAQTGLLDSEMRRLHAIRFETSDR